MVVSAYYPVLPPPGRRSCIVALHRSGGRLQPAGEQSADGRGEVLGFRGVAYATAVGVLLAVRYIRTHRRL